MHTLAGVAVNPLIQSSVVIYVHQKVYDAISKSGDATDVTSVVSGPSKPLAIATIDGRPYAITTYSQCCCPVRKPRSKKKRIQNKWHTDPRHWEDLDVAYLVDRSKPFLGPQLISNFARPYWTPEAPLFQGLAQLVSNRAREMGR